MRAFKLVAHSDALINTPPPMFCYTHSWWRTSTARTRRWSPS